jgi:hypothetical protein
LKLYILWTIYHSPDSSFEDDVVGPTHGFVQDAFGAFHLLLVRRTPTCPANSQNDLEMTLQQQQQLLSEQQNIPVEVVAPLEAGGGGDGGGDDVVEVHATQLRELEAAVGVEEAAWRNSVDPE